MSGMNKAIIIGHVGQDPKSRAAGGQTVCNFSVATSEKWTKDGKTEERTEWHNIAAWGKLAELVGKYVAKGSLVAVEGKLQTRSYDKDGSKHYATEIVASNVTFLSKPVDRSAPASRTGPEDDDIRF